MILEPSACVWKHHPMPAPERYSSTGFAEDKSFQEHNPSSMLCFQSSTWKSEQCKTKSWITRDNSSLVWCVACAPQISYVIVPMANGRRGQERQNLGTHTSQKGKQFIWKEDKMYTQTMTARNLCLVTGFQPEHTLAPSREAENTWNTSFAALEVSTKFRGNGAVHVLAGESRPTPQSLCYIKCWHGSGLGKITFMANKSRIQPALVKHLVGIMKEKYCWLPVSHHPPVLTSSPPHRGHALGFPRVWAVTCRVMSGDTE